MRNSNHAWVVAIALTVSAVFAVKADEKDVVSEIKAAQARFIADINNRDYEKVVAAFHESYKGLITEKGFMTLIMRKDMFKTGFASDDPATVTVLETDIRPLGEDYALLQSHIKVEHKKEKAPKDWWYTAIYFRCAGAWKLIHEH